MGELRDDHADAPPRPHATPADRAHTREPEPGTTNDPRAIRAAFRKAESPAFAIPHALQPKPHPPDGPTHHAPDLEPPTGPELTETDAPSRGAELRKQLFDEENLGDIDDILDHVNEAIDDIWVNKPDRGPSTHTQTREPHSVLHAPDHALDTRDALTAMFFTGILLGETVRVVYRKASELKERRQHAGHG